MTADEIIAMAREAGAGLSSIAEPLERPWKLSQDELERFAALVAAKEREACAQVCEKYGTSVTTKDCAAAIRARSKP